MTTLRFPRFERTLGVSLNELKFEHLVQLAARFTSDPVLEDFDLEFKERVYDENEKNRRELPADIAAMANSQGGIILLGIKAENGAAKEAVELPLTEAEELRMTNMILSAIFPRPRFEFLRVVKATDPTKGCFAILVPRSLDAPHAVRLDENYRYYRRDSAAKRIMWESEIADAYRSRFHESDNQVQRLQKVASDGASQLSRTGMGWFSMSLVPNNPGGMNLTNQSLQRLKSWIRTYTQDSVTRIPAFYVRTAHQRIGARRVKFSAGRNNTDHLSEYSYAELHTDGSGFYSYWLSQNPNGKNIEPQALSVHDSCVTELALCGLRLLADHAIGNAGCHGDALVSASIVLPKGMSNIIPIEFSSNDFSPSQPLDPIPCPDESSATVNLDEIVGSWRGTLLATRLVLADFMQACGIPQCRQISELGELNHQTWPNEGLQEWTQRARLNFNNRRD